MDVTYGCGLAPCGGPVAGIMCGLIIVRRMLGRLATGIATAADSANYLRAEYLPELRFCHPRILCVK